MSIERYEIQKDLEFLYDRLYKIVDQNEYQLGMFDAIDIAIQIVEGSLEPEDVKL
ncbi:MAG: hypothetical protein VW270_08480 [Candidatus Poseidoniales archaeon]